MIRERMATGDTQVPKVQDPALQRLQRDFSLKVQSSFGLTGETPRPEAEHEDQALC